MNKFAIAALILAALIGGNTSSAAPANNRPNILLIIADDCTYRDLGLYGGQAKTPNLETLASEGLRQGSQPAVGIPAAMERFLLARILVVDDDVAVQSTLRLLLERAGHSGVTAGDGRKGLSFCETGDFDLERPTTALRIVPAHVQRSRRIAGANNSTVKHVTGNSSGAA